MKFEYVVVLLAVAALGLSAFAPVASGDKPDESQAQQVIKIMGAASAYPPLESLAESYKSQVSGTNIVFLPGSHTAGGIVGVQNGLADIGIVSRGLLPEESRNLRYSEFASDMLAVATYSGLTGVTNLSSDQLRAIYTGAVHNWSEVGGPDAEIVVLDRTNDDSAKTLLRKRYLGMESKSSPSAIILGTEGEMAGAIQDTPNSIGTISLGYALGITQNLGDPLSHQRLGINFLSLDGVAPTLDNAAAGKYPMVRTLGLVTTPTLSLAAQRFLDYVTSDAGAAGLRRCGLLPLVGRE